MASDLVPLSGLKQINEATKKKKNEVCCYREKQREKVFCSKPVSIKLGFKNKSVKASAATLLQTGGILTFPEKFVLQISS